MNALTTTQDREELIAVLESSLYPGAQRESIIMVLGYCSAAGLDPMLKPVHIVPMWDGKARRMRDVVMPGIGLYRTQASRTGQFAGQSEPEFGPMVTETLGGQQITFPEWCRITVRRLLPGGVIAEFTSIEYWIENYATKGGQEKSIAPNAMWTKRPRGQLAKCTEAQALRKAFPELGAVQTADEMEGRSIHADDIEVSPRSGAPTPPPAPSTAAPTWPDDKFALQFERYSKAVAAGLKTVDEIMAMARSKGSLTAEQEGQIKALKKADVTDVEASPSTPHQPAADADPFLAELNEAEAAQGAAQ